MLKIWVWYFLKKFYSRIEITGLHLLPKDGPVLLIANHRNALMDALILGCISPRPISFLARASAFKPPFASFLHYINMLPVYRERDGWDSIEKNSAIFNECSDRLAGHGMIALFPEGMHHQEEYLYPLKKGFARIGYEALMRDVPSVYVQPIGINYEKIWAYNRRLYLRFGTGYELTWPADFSEKDLPHWLNEAKQKAEQAIRNVIIDMPPKPEYKEAEKVFSNWRKSWMRIWYERWHDHFEEEKKYEKDPSGSQLSSHIYEEKFADPYGIRRLWILGVVLFSPAIVAMGLLLILAKFIAGKMVKELPFFSTAYFMIWMLLCTFLFAIIFIYSFIVFPWYIALLIIAITLAMFSGGARTMNRIGLWFRDRK